MADAHTPLRDIANTTPTRDARASASARKRTDNAEAASTPSGRSATPTATPQTDNVDGAKRAASVEIDAVILAFERAGAYASFARWSRSRARSFSTK